MLTGLVACGAAARIARIHDQYSQFVSLESGLFSLGLPSTYLQLNDPAAQDSAIEAAVAAVVDGLLCVLLTAGVVPIIRCPRGGAAEHVATQLDAKLRDALKARANLFRSVHVRTEEEGVAHPACHVECRNHGLAVALLLAVFGRLGNAACFACCLTLCLYSAMLQSVGRGAVCLPAAAAALPLRPKL